MEIILYVVRTVTSTLLVVLLGAMFVRAIMSWLPTSDGGVLDTISYALTEPLIVPVRMLLERIEWVRNAPLDVSFFVTFLIISLLFDALV